MGKKQEKKFLISLMSALIFFVVANPETFMFMRRMLGDWVSSAAGCPSPSGLVLHAFVFFLVVWGLMNLDGAGAKLREKFENMPSSSTADEDDDMDEDLDLAAPKVSVEDSTVKMSEEEEDEDLDLDLDLDAETLGGNSAMETGLDMKKGGKKPSSMLGAAPLSSAPLGEDESMFSELAPYEGQMKASPPSGMTTGSYSQCTCADGSKLMVMKS